MLPPKHLVLFPSKRQKKLTVKFQPKLFNFRETALTKILIKSSPEEKNKKNKTPNNKTMFLSFCKQKAQQSEVATYYAVSVLTPYANNKEKCHNILKSPGHEVKSVSNEATFLLLFFIL